MEIYLLFTSGAKFFQAKCFEQSSCAKKISGISYRVGSLRSKWNLHCRCICKQIYVSSGIENCYLKQMIFKQWRLRFPVFLPQREPQGSGHWKSLKTGLVERFGVSKGNASPNLSRARALAVCIQINCDITDFWKFQFTGTLDFLLMGRIWIS